MVKNIINISERESRILNLVKAKFGMKNKNQALGLIIQTYADNFLEKSLLPPEEKAKRESATKINDVEELKKRIRE
jgi:hypothetical protein